MKFNEINDCDECPLKGDHCQQHPDSFHPCEHGDLYGEMELDELVAFFDARRKTYEQKLELQYEKEEEKKRKENEKQNKRKQTNKENYLENKQISNCRKMIRKLNQNIFALESIIGVSQIVNSFTNSTTIESLANSNHPRIIYLKEKIKQYEEKIVELNKIKNERKKKRG